MTEQFPGFPHVGYPEGWFGIGWSEDFPPAEIVSRQVFGEQIVLWRADDGRLTAMGAFCPHQGAHLGVGGRLENGCLVCPFHGWSWDPQGCNASVPYGPKAKVGVHNRTWPILEVSGHVCLWHSWRSPEPTWELPDLSFLDDPRVFWGHGESTRQWLGRRMVPQLVTENIVDFSHIKYVHLADEESEVTEYTARGPVFSVTLRQVFRTGSGPVVGIDHIDAYGVGLHTARMQFRDYEITNLLTTVPVTPSRSEMRATIAIRLPDRMGRPQSASDLPDRFQRAIKAHLDSQEQDLPIWENMIYRDKVPFAPEEARPSRALRKWAATLYAPANDAPEHRYIQRAPASHDSSRSANDRSHP
jgi:3-ketosteroid 9alpha-monooxygenase subunit A